MEKKKKPIQLLPFDYLVKIGRIKKENDYWRGNRGVHIQESIKQGMIKHEGKELEIEKILQSGYYVYIKNWYGLQTNWLKP